jgi:hypothetical protein
VEAGHRRRRRAIGVWVGIGDRSFFFFYLGIDRFR